MEFAGTTTLEDGTEVTTQILYNEDNDTKENDGNDWYYFFIKTDDGEVYLNEDEPYYDAIWGQELEDLVQEYQDEQEDSLENIEAAQLEK